ncbi:hypothetical protein HYDPIDRAFT_106199 [Hydnomerulius pinastri MD-312]|nr:hypothetical protein HYDPIDRAFT_106199 [Hydnomerulius pinastri MD-312]
MPSLPVPASGPSTSTAITDIYSVLTATPPNTHVLVSSPGSSASATVILVPAIVGATCGGMIIAIAAWFGWKRWSKGSDRASQQETLRPRRVLRKGERRTRTRSSEKNSTSMSSSSSNAGFLDEKDRKHDMPSPIEEAPRDVPESNPRTHERTTSIPRPISIRPPRPPKNSAREMHGIVKVPSANRLSRGLSYKASTISSVSMYSTQSGEEHQVRVPPAVILAALGPNFDRRAPMAGGSTPTASLPPVGEGNELITSNVHTRRAPGAYQPPQPTNRLSQISNGSLNLQMPDHGPSLPIGLAYGGEE